MTAVHAALAKRFPSPEWATFFEVRDDAGFKARRAADVVAMNTWPSRGLEIHGVEVKVDRRDWLRELRDPAKSAPVQRYCDRWWLAVSDEHVAKVDEVPVTWGLLVLNGKGLKTVKDAPKLEATPPDRGFVAVLLRCATNGVVPMAQLAEMVEERVKQRVESERGHVGMERDRFKKDYESLAKRVAAFEKESGIDLLAKNKYGPIADPSKLGAAVRVILEGSGVERDGHLQHAKNLVDALSRDLGAAIEAMRAVNGAAA